MCKWRARAKPKVLSSQIIRRIDDHHAQLINRMRHGQMIIPGQTLYVLECQPAAYAALAANEAEKASNINVLEVRAFGAVVLVLDMLIGRLPVEGVWRGTLSSTS